MEEPSIITGHPVPAPQEHTEPAPGAHAPPPASHAATDLAHGAPLSSPAPPPAPARSLWSSWDPSPSWGLSALSEKLQEVAAGTMQELQSSLQELRRTLGEEEPGAAAATGPNNRSGDGNGPQGGGGAGEDSQAAVSGGGEHADQRPVASTAEGEGEGKGQREGDGGSAAPVDASHAAEWQSTVNELWGKVEAATRHTGEAVNVQEVLGRLERGLESVGRSALDLLEGFVGRTADGEGEEEGKRHAAGIAVASAYASAAPAASPVPGPPPVPSSFDDFFALYGGPTLCEELARLANDSARACNKARAQLAAEQQADLDAALSRLGTFFVPDLAAGDTHEEAEDEEVPETSCSAGTCEAGDALATPAVGESSAVECWAQLEDRFAPMDYLVQDSLARCAAHARAGGEGEAPGGGGAHNEDAQGTSGQDQQAAEARRQLTVHSFKRLAEIAAAQVQVLLDLGASLASPLHLSGSAQAVAASGPELLWPPDMEQQAQLIRRVAKRMCADTQRVAAAYAAATRRLAAGAEGLEHAEPALGATTEVAAVSTAAEHEPLQDGREKVPDGSERGLGEKGEDAGVGPTALGSTTQAAAVSTAAEHKSQDGGDGLLDEGTRGQGDVGKDAGAGATALGLLHEAYRGLLYCILARYAASLAAAAEP